MYIRLAVGVVLVTMLAGCGNRPPAVADPHQPLDAGGRVIKPIEYLKLYCDGVVGDPNCEKVRQAFNQDASKGGLPKGY